jgi:prolyl-tRNA synthetase
MIRNFLKNINIGISFLLFKILLNELYNGVSMSEQLGITVKKHENFSEWFSEVCFKAELVDQRYNVQGFIVHKPWAMKIIKKIYEFLENELENKGHKPVLFPVVIPEENFEREKEHVEGFKPEVFWVTEAGDNKLEKRLALRPTSETAFYQMYSLWIRSHRDLPLKLYQSVAVYRYESQTRPFLRGREFLWIEAHDAFKSYEEASEQIKDDMEVCKKVIYDKLAIPFIFFKRPQWDKFAGANDTYAADTLMPDGKVNQISSTHDLGQKFAKAFGVQFLNEKDEKEYVWQTCFGLGVWRIIAALIAVHGDDRGLMLPVDIAPIQVIIIPIYSSESEKDKVIEKCEMIKNILNENKIRCEIDLRDETPGWKFNDWELKGVPLRVEIGPKEVKEDLVTIARRDTGEKIKIKTDELLGCIKKLSTEILNNLKQRAADFFNSRIVRVVNRDEIIESLNKGKVVIMDFCGREECAMEMKETTHGGKVRGTIVGGYGINIRDEKPKGKCAWCGKDSKEVVYVAKAY